MDHGNAGGGGTGRDRRRGCLVVACAASTGTLLLLIAAVLFFLFGLPPVLDPGPSPDPDTRPPLPAQTTFATGAGTARAGVTPGERR